MKKNFDRRISHCHNQWLKAPRTGATRTLSWIARIHSHTCINTVTTTSCKAPAQRITEFGIYFFIVKYQREPEGGANRSTWKQFPIS